MASPASHRAAGSLIPVGCAAFKAANRGGWTLCAPTVLLEPTFPFCKATFTDPSPTRTPPHERAQELLRQRVVLRRSHDPDGPDGVRPGGLAGALEQLGKDEPRRADAGPPGEPQEEGDQGSH